MTYPSSLIISFLTTTAVSAATVVETPTGRVTAWFGGREEGDPFVVIWLSHRQEQKWTTPVEVADSNQTSVDVPRFPCGNPVLHEASERVLQLYYEVGPHPRQ